MSSDFVTNSYGDLGLILRKIMSPSPELMSLSLKKQKQKQKNESEIENVWAFM